LKIFREKNTDNNKSEMAPQSTVNSSRALPAEGTARTSTQLWHCFLVWALTPRQQELPVAGIQQLTFQAFATPAVLDGTPCSFVRDTSMPSG